jgi:hypothetical protein
MKRLEQERHIYLLMIGHKNIGNKFDFKIYRRKYIGIWDDKKIK